MPSRRTFLEKSATLAALGFLPREISAEEWLAEHHRSSRETPAKFKGKNVVIVLSGGNVDADLFAKLIG